MSLPTDYKERKAIPIGTGVLDYFPLALAEVAKVSLEGNRQHNPGQPLHWQRGKSTDHYDTLTRHGMERGTIDTDGQRHSAKMAWRALALLQEELEAACGDGKISRGSWPAVPIPPPIILTDGPPQFIVDRKYADKYAQRKD